MRSASHAHGEERSGAVGEQLGEVSATLPERSGCGERRSISTIGNAARSPLNADQISNAEHSPHLAAACGPQPIEWPTFPDDRKAILQQDLALRVSPPMTGTTHRDAHTTCSGRGAWQPPAHCFPFQIQEDCIAIAGAKPYEADYARDRHENARARRKRKLQWIHCACLARGLWDTSTILFERGTVRPEVYVRLVGCGTRPRE